MSKYIFTKQHIGTAFYFDDYESVNHWYMGVIKFAYDHGMEPDNDRNIFSIFDKIISGQTLTVKEEDNLYWENYDARAWINYHTEPPLSFEDDGDSWTFDDWS
jgi:hypothetical protein